MYRSYFNTLLMPLIVAARAWGRVTGREGGDDSMPSPLVNGLLRRLFSAERHALGRFALPVGVSLGVVAERAIR